MKDQQRRRALLAWLCPALLPGTAAVAQPAYAPASVAVRSKPMPEAQRLERRFLQVAAAHLDFQAEAARQVLARSKNAEVRELASTLLSRHRTAQPEVLRLLHVRGMAPPMLSNEQGKLLKALPKLQGARLDRVFVEEVALKACQADIPQYEKALAVAEDPQLRAFAERQLPVLRMQLAKAGRVLPARAAQRSL
jgi:putative membrane protein